MARKAESRRARRPGQVPGALRHAAQLARIRADQSRRSGDPAGIARVRALVDPRRRDDFGNAAAARVTRRTRRNSCCGTRSTSSRTARCRAASTGAAPTRCRRTTAPASSCSSIDSVYRYTGDVQLLRELWPATTKAVAYMDKLRRVGAHGSEPAGRSQGVLRPDAGVDQSRRLLGEADAFVLGRFLGARRLRVGDPDRARARPEDGDARVHRIARSVPPRHVRLARRQRCRHTRSTICRARRSSATSTPPRLRSRCRRSASSRCCRRKRWSRRSSATARTSPRAAPTRAGMLTRRTSGATSARSSACAGATARWS